ncbi:hypothetical protein ACLB1M_32335 [Escherichia coli]
MRERAVVREMISVANEIAEAGFDPQGRTSEICWTLLNPASLKLPKVVQTKTKGRRTSPMCSTQPWRVLSSCFSSHTMALPE